MINISEKQWHGEKIMNLKVGNPEFKLQLLITSSVILELLLKPF